MIDRSRVSQSHRGGKAGCTVAGCLGTAIGVPLLLILICYLVIFHSSLPLKWVAGALADEIDADGNSVEFKGVGGSLSSGLTAKEIIIHGDTENSTIEGFSFRYNGLWDSVRNEQFIIEELSIQRSDIVVAPDFFESSSDEEEPGETDETGDDSSPDEDSDDSKSGRFELRELNFENTRFRTTDGEIDVEIPRFRLAGLKIEGDDFELAELEVISDVLTLELLDAEPDEIAGQRVPFSRKIQGTVLPGIHPAVTAEIGFSVEFAAAGGEPVSRIIAFGGAFEQTALPEGRSLVWFKNLTLGDYFDPQDHLLPERLTATTSEVEGIVTMESGEFYLGKTRFEITRQLIEADDPASVILGSGQFGDHTFTASLRPEKERLWPPLKVKLASEPKLDPPAILARVYFHRPYAELAPEEKSRIDAMASQMTGQP